MLANDRIAAMVIMALSAVGCGGSSGHPDTGAGAHQSVPATETCMDLCQRVATCVEILCNEDTKSTRFLGAGSVLVPACLASCTDATVMSTVPPAHWTCLFESSCRQVLEFEVCDEKASYRCS